VEVAGGTVETVQGGFAAEMDVMVVMEVCSEKLSQVRMVRVELTEGMDRTAVMEGAAVTSELFTL